MMKSLLFTAVLIYASVIDIRSLIVPTSVHILLLLTGLIGFNLSALKWALLVFVILYVIAYNCPGFGPGDMKFGAMCGFVMGEQAIYALITGLLLFVVVVPIYCKINHKPIRGTSIPLVPFLALGCLCKTILIH